MAEIRMPQLGETVTEGTILHWFKQVGDAIAEDEPLYEVSTDKVDTEVPSSNAGILQEIVVKEGETVPIGALLAIVGDGTPSEPSAPSVVPAERPAAIPPTPPAAVRSEPPAPARTNAEPTRARPHECRATAPARTSAEATAPARTSAEATAPARTSAEATAPARTNAEATAPARADGARNRWLSPVVARLLAEHGLDAATITGTGAEGRITRDDVLKAAARPAPQESRPAAPAPPSAPATTSPPRTEHAPVPEPWADDEIVPFNTPRRVTAEHLMRSLATSAHTLVVMAVDYSAVDAVRRAAKLTYLPFVARAVCDAIQRFPKINSSVGHEQLHVHRLVNLGISVDLDFEGLVVPVVRDAGGLRLRRLGETMTQLAERARARRLGADDYAGGTFTITNAGGYGTLITGPIINQPQTAILSTDGVRMSPVAVPIANGEYAIAVHPVGNLALSFDHRAFDGSYASAFLAEVRRILETRNWTDEL